MTTEIFDNNPGRQFSSYDLLTETTDRYSITREDAHEAIHAMLTGIAETSTTNPVIDRRPANPELLTHNPHMLDIRYWLEISDETDQAIREALAASFADAVDTDDEDDTQDEDDEWA